MRLSYIEGRVAEGDAKLREELNDKFKRIFTVNDTITPTLRRLDGVEDLEGIYIVKKDVL